MLRIQPCVIVPLALSIWSMQALSVHADELKGQQKVTMVAITQGGPRAHAIKLMVYCVSRR